MRVLVIGGTGFVGPFVVRRLVARGVDVVVFHRGTTEAELPHEVSRWLGDRRQISDYRAPIERFSPDIVLDTRPMTGQQSRQVMQSLKGLARRIVSLSSGDVYRAYGILRQLECGPLEPVPIAEDAPCGIACFHTVANRRAVPTTQCAGLTTTRKSWSNEKSWPTTLCPARFCACR